MTTTERPTSAVSPERRIVDTKRLFPGGGIAFVALVVASLLVGGGTPDSGATAIEVASFYGEDAARQWLSAFLLAAASPFAVLFGVGLAATLSNGTRWGDLVRAGGILVAGALLLAAGVHIAIVDGGEQGISATALQALNTLDGNTWIAMTSGVGVLLLGAAGALLSSGTRRLLGWSALVLGVALFLPFVDFLAIIPSALWIVVASVASARESAVHGAAVPVLEGRSS
jgi:hypothetical protein